MKFRQVKVRSDSFPGVEREERARRGGKSDKTLRRRGEVGEVRGILMGIFHFKSASVLMTPLVVTSSQSVGDFPFKLPRRRGRKIKLFSSQALSFFDSLRLQLFGLDARFSPFRA